MQGIVSEVERHTVRGRQIAGGPPKAQRGAWKRNRFMCYDPRGGKVLISVGR